MVDWSLGVVSGAVPVGGSSPFWHFGGAPSSACLRNLRRLGSVRALGPTPPFPPLDRWCDVRDATTSVYPSVRVVTRRLLPRLQLQVTLTVTATSPFLQPPRLQVGYAVAGQALSQALSLPLVATKFVAPPAGPIARDDFFNQWRSIAGVRPVCLSACLSALS
jgi:hypothetical protein